MRSNIRPWIGGVIVAVVLASTPAFIGLSAEAAGPYEQQESNSHAKKIDGPGSIK